MSYGKVINDNGLEKFDPDNGNEPLGLGLNITPNSLKLCTDTLAMNQPLLSYDECKERINRSDFTDGEDEFDGSFTTYQNGYGSCAGYAIASAGTKARVRQGFPRVDLSGDYQYSRVNDNRDRGSGLQENMESFMRNGCATAKTVKLGQIFRSSYNTSIADAEAKRFKGWELFATPDEQSIVNALVNKMFVIVAIHVTNRWQQFDSEGMLAECNGVGNHCEHLDGIRWNNRKSRFELRKASSHGRNYGQDGYCWTTWDLHYKTSSRYHVFYAINSLILDPELDLFNYEFKNNPSPLPTDTLEIKMYSRSNCRYCVKWKQEVQPLAEENGWKVEIVDNSGGDVPRYQINVKGNVIERIGFISWSELKNLTTVR